MKFGLLQKSCFFILLALLASIFLSGCITESPVEDDLVDLESIGHLIVQETAGKKIIRAAFDPLIISANELYVATKGKGIVVADASRTPAQQADMFYRKCLVHSDGKCRPAVCEPTKNPKLVSGNSKSGYKLVGILANEKDRNTIITTLANNSKPKNCPHTSNVALDVWCEGVSGMKVDPQCQKALTEIMVQNGFCRLSSEAWHFEWDAKKRSEESCTQSKSATYTIDGNSHDPLTDGKGNECILWDYKVHKCLKIKTGLSVYDGTYSGTFNYEYRDSYYVAGSDEKQFTEWKEGSFELTVTFKTRYAPNPNDPEAHVSLDITNAFSTDPNFGTEGSGVNPSGSFTDESASLPVDPAKQDAKYAYLVLAFPNNARIEAKEGAIKVSSDGKTLSNDPNWVSPCTGTPCLAWEAKTPQGPLSPGTPTAESGVWMTRHYAFKNWSLTKASP